MFLCHPFQNLQASICLLLVIDVSSVATVPVHDLDVAVSVAPLKPLYIGVQMIELPSGVFTKYTKLAIMPMLASEALLCENKKIQ